MVWVNLYGLVRDSKAPLSDGAAFLLAGAEAVLLLATILLTDADEDALRCLVLINRAKDVLLQTQAL